MTEDVWRPLGFETETGVEFRGLTDGIPQWLSQSFWDWVAGQLTERVASGFGGGRSYYSRFNTALLRKAERVCHFSVPYVGSDVDTGVAHLRKVSRSLSNELRLADFLLSETEKKYERESLDSHLREAGSAWMVGERYGKPGLVRRVAEGVQVAAENTMQISGHAGERLAEAWTAAFGIDPNPSAAYSLAIKAVEDAAIPVVSPTNGRATLGTIIGQLKDQGDWALPFQRYDRDVPAPSVVIGQMKTLWAGQVDRHGGAEDTIIAVSQEAAEAAVLMAVPLVHAFSSGLVARRAT